MMKYQFEIINATNDHVVTRLDDCSRIDEIIKVLLNEGLNLNDIAICLLEVVE